MNGSRGGSIPPHATNQLKHNDMKKVRTLKELQNHPYVREIDYEYQDAIYDGHDYIYVLYLIDGKKWECLDSGMITSPTIKQLIEEFYYYDIISI